MRNFVALAVAVAAAVSLSASTVAAAQPARTFVSGHGADTGNCALSAPCRTFAYAAGQTAAGGEITVLDSAGYGVVTLTQSITITNPGGVEAGITAPSGQTAITINTPAAAAITLRGLTLEGGGVGASGVNLMSALPPNTPAGGTLNIIDCVVKDFTGDGVTVQPSLAGGVGGVPTLKLVVADSFMLNNGGNGVTVAPPNINIIGGIYRTIISSNANGLNLGGAAGVNLLFDNSSADYNATSGIVLSNGSLRLRSSTAVLNGGVAIANTANLFLFDRNFIDEISNMGIAYTDGTNNIFAVTGAALNKQSPQ